MFNYLIEIVGNNEDSIKVEYRAVSCVFQNIDPPPISPPGECVLPPTKAGGIHSPGGEGAGGGESIFWKTQDVGLTSYSNNLSTVGKVPYLLGTAWKGK
jgi:hypothetical protein